MRSLRRRALPIVIVSCLLVVPAACGGRSGGETTSAGPTTAPPPPTTAAPAPTTVAPTTVATPTTTAGPTPTQSPVEEFLAVYAGEWTGTWTNTTFGSTGDIAALLEIVDDGRLALEVDLGGAVFGQDDPPPDRWIVAFTDLLGPVTLQSTTFGEITLILSTEGARLTAAAVPAEGISLFQLDARFDPGPTIVGTYLVGFDDGSIAEGTAEMQQTRS